MTEYVRHLRTIVGGDELLQIPSVTIALRDRAGRVLVARHSEAGAWVLPGGAIEPAEIPADAAVREMFEETGLFVRLTRLVGVFGGPEFIVHYRNGHRTSYVMSVFEAEIESGDAHPDGSELLELQFVSAHEAEGIHKAPWLDEVLRAVFRNEPSTCGFRAPTWRPRSAPQG